MRKLLALGALAAAQVVAATPGHAYDGPWCAQFWGGDSQYENCSMRSFDMCLREIHGTGGNTLCSPNPYYRPEPSAPERRRRRTG